MSDMIQINIQAILSEVSQKKILTDIEGIQAKINGKPLTIKVETNSSELNSLTSKMKSLYSQVEKPIKLNIDSSAINKASDSFKVFDIAGEKVAKLIGTTRQYTNALGQTVTVAEKFKAIMNKAGTGFEETSSTPIITYGNNLEATRLKAEKLIVTQNKLRASMESLGSTPLSSKPLAVNANSLINGLNENSTVVDQQKAQTAVDAVTSAFKRQETVEKEAQQLANTVAKERQNKSNQRISALRLEEAEQLKLANAIGKVHEQSQARVIADRNASQLKQSTASNNALDANYTQSQKDEQARVAQVQKDEQAILRTRQEASDTARRMTVAEENERVATTTSAQRRIEQSILGSNETIAQAQTRISSAQENGNRYEQMYLQAAREREVLDTRNAETARQTVITTEQETAELRRQIALYQERNNLAIRNIQASGGRLAQTPAMQASIGAVQGTVAGLSSSVLNAEGFRAQTASINTSMSSIRTGLNEASVATNNFGNDLVKNGIKMLQWSIVGGILFSSLRGIKEGFSFINDLDKQMTNIQMVTGKSRESIMEMTKAYADLASQLHTTTSEVMTAAQEFLRAGHTQEEAILLIKSATVMSAISGQDSKSSADQLIAITNGFAQEFAKTGETAAGVIDKLTTVDNLSATSTRELGTALERTSVSAQMAGTSFSSLVSYIATVSSVSRKSASSIGESFKTMFSRFQDVKGGKKFDADNEDVSNVERDFKKYADINIRETSGQFKDFSTVIEQLSGKWNTMSQVEQSASAKALAG